jgi:hypothetical protein
MSPRKMTPEERTEKNKGKSHVDVLRKSVSGRGSKVGISETLRRKHVCHMQLV